MTLREIIEWFEQAATTCVTWLAEIFVEFVQLFFWEKDWLDGNIPVLLLVLFSYFAIASRLMSGIKVLIEAIEHYGKYLFNSEYRKKRNKNIKLEREAERNLKKIVDEKEKQIIEARKAELSSFGRFIYFIQRYPLGSLFIFYWVVIFVMVIVDL